MKTRTLAHSMRMSLSLGARWSIDVLGHVERQCNQCGQYKRFTANNFNRTTANKFGFQGTCKVCRADYCRQRRTRLREGITNESD